VVKPANEKAALKPVQGDALLRELESHADWFAVEFLVYYERSRLGRSPTFAGRTAVTYLTGNTTCEKAKTRVAASGKNGVGSGK